MNVDLATLLRDLNFEVTDGFRDVWQIRKPDGSTIERKIRQVGERVTMQVVREHLPRPTVESLRPLFVAETATAAAHGDARKGNFDLATASPMALVIDGRTFAVPTAEVRAPTRVPGPPAWGRWAIMRLLVSSATALTQSQIAERIGVSQQATSKAIRRCGNLIARCTGGYIARDRQELLAAWLHEYPGPGGTEFGWYSLGGVVAETHRAAEAAQGYGAEPLIGGDVAADALAPWKLPGRGLLYVQSPVDLTNEGFLPAPRAEATLIVRIPADPTVWRSAQGLGERARNSTDPLLIYWDVLAGNDVDSADAAEAIAKALPLATPEERV